MDVAQVVLLIGAVSGLIIAIGGSVTPILIARMKRDQEEKPEVEQGQPVPASDTEARLRAELAAYRRALQRQHNQAAEHGLRLYHPDID